MKRAEASALLLVVTVGLALRVLFAWNLPYHVDEPASVLAFQRVAATSWPIYPSGVLYLQGATLSYLAAPLAWLGLDTPDQPGWVRLVPVLAGTGAIGVAWGMARSLGPWVALVCALAVALDPIGVQWSAHLRPYSLLQLVSLAIAWRTAVLLRERTHDTLLLPVLFALGAFTHLLVTVLLPGMLLAAVWVHGRALLSARRDVLLTGLGCAIGPLAVVLLNRVFAVSSAGASDAAGAVSFVGNHLLDPAKLLEPTLYVWGNLLVRYGSGELALVLLLVPLGGLLLAGWRGEADRDDPAGLWSAIGFLGIGLLALFADTDQERYSLHLHTLVLVGSVASLRFLPRVMAGGLLALLLLGQGEGLTYTWRQEPRSVDYRPLHVHLSRYHVPGEPIITPMPALTAWFLPDRRSDIVFLAGAEDSARPQRYTHPGPDGSPVDFWLGVESLVSTDSWCDFVEANPRAWVFWDLHRTRVSNVFRGRMGRLLKRLDVRAKGPDGSRLGRVDERERGPCRTRTDGDGR